MQRDRRDSPARTVHELEELRRALDASAILAITDRDGIIRHVNDRFCAMAGYSRAELVGQTHRVVSSGHHDRAFFEDLWRTILGGSIWRGRIQNRRKDGTLYWVDTVITPMFGTSDAPESFLAVRHDVTELVRTSEALHESQHRFRAILDNAAVGIAVVDLEDHILEGSAALRRMLRCEHEELTQHPFTDFAVPEHPGLDRELFAELVAGHRDHYQIDRRYLRCDGTSFLGHTTVSLVRREDGSPDHVIGVIQDVTAARETERQLREQGALARLGEMSAIIAHEVRNPLAGIRGAVEIIGRSLGDSSHEREVVASIVRRIADLDDLLTQLLLFARPTTPRLVRTSLGSLLSRVREHVGPDALILEGDDVELLADPALLERAFSNLALNGVQATGGGPVRVVISRHADVCSVELHDPGNGIPPEHRERIFEPFFTTKSRGAGLGLAITKAAVEAHDGTIELVESVPGHTCFRVSLPLGPGVNAP
ncbi:MAG: PAS domain S-box protein [Sandaracinaceae bacterium]|nr:PAS domain S-box protein [Sandaracinaceae bacterium]